MGCELPAAGSDNGLTRHNPDARSMTKPETFSENRLQALSVRTF